ncbi:MAG: alpha/beta hydrolase-fold protein [Bacteroidota bacterium]
MKSRKTPKRLSIAATFKYLSVASLITTAAAQKSLALDHRNSVGALGEHFTGFLDRVRSSPGTARQQIVDEFATKLKAYGRAIVEDSVVYFVYQGEATRVAVPGDLNGWHPASDTMTAVEGTDLFYLPKTIDMAARFEYKFAVDSTWILDPFNQQQAIGGYGANSEIWMPRYVPPTEILPNPDIPHGRIDTFAVESTLLGRTHPVFVYLPPNYKKQSARYPVIYVTDGGEYLSLGLMNNVLDNLIAAKRIQPVIGVFIDPRTDIRDAATSMRMHDYTMSDTFVNFLVTELVPRIRKNYRVTDDPANTAIMGASLGGLIATYASYKHPDVFGLCAAQSSSYWWNKDSIVALMREGPKKHVRFYIDTGTIFDAQEGVRKMRDVLRERGYEFSYAEYPEGHNWVNWRARIDAILEYFWGLKR